VVFEPGEQGTFDAVVYNDLSPGSDTPESPETSCNPGWVFAGWEPQLSPKVYGDAVYIAQWTPNSFTVTFEPGAQGTFNAVVHNNVPHGSATPAPPETPGNPGWVFAGWEPQLSPTVTGNAIYVAQWNNSGGGGGGSGDGGDNGGGRNPYIPTTRPTPPTEPELIFPPTLIPASPGGIVTLPPEPPAPEQTPAEPPAQAAVVEIEEPLVPLIAPPIMDAPLGMKAWALLNLILCTIGAIFAAATVIRATLQKKREPNEADDTYNPDEDEGQIKRCNFTWLVTTAILGILSVLLFLLTQDMTNPMVLSDNWTLVHAAILAVEVIAIMLAFQRVMETVSFKIDSDSTAFIREIHYGNALEKPKTPLSTGYLFAGWFTDDNFDNEWNFNDKVKNSFSLYAKWDEIHATDFEESNK